MYMFLEPSRQIGFLSFFFFSGRITILLGTFLCVWFSKIKFIGGDSVFLVHFNLTIKWLKKDQMTQSYLEIKITLLPTKLRALAY